MSEQQSAYRVASLLPEHARRAAVEAEYDTGYAGVLRRRTFLGCCPLGVATMVIGGRWFLAPDALAFATYAVDMALCDAEEEAYAREAALEFIEDWDNGLITDLAAALDVEPSATSQERSSGTPGADRGTRTSALPPGSLNDETQ